MLKYNNCNVYTYEKIYAFWKLFIVFDIVNYVSDSKYTFMDRQLESRILEDILQGTVIPPPFPIPPSNHQIERIDKLNYLQRELLCPRRPWSTCKPFEMYSILRMLDKRTLASF